MAEENKVNQVPETISIDGVKMLSGESGKEELKQLTVRGDNGKQTIIIVNTKG